jgi:NADP-dependent 3-hydroxy acid dehydrogenase YdfG
VLLARNIQALESLHLPNSVCAEVDVTDLSAVQSAIEQAEQQLGPLDCLINNAGVGFSGDFSEISHEQNLQMVEVNLLGVVNGVEAVLPQMRQRKHGTIINISSVADRNSRPQLAVYAATKAAVKSLTESLRAANAIYNTRFTNIAPAKINTPLLKSSSLDTDEVIDPVDLAKAVLWVYQQPQSICIRDLVIAPTQYLP